MMLIHFWGWGILIATIAIFPLLVASCYSTFKGCDRMGMIQRNLQIDLQILEIEMKIREEAEALEDKQ